MFLIIIVIIIMIVVFLLRDMKVGLDVLDEGGIRKRQNDSLARDDSK
jgi:hypothetical protein